MSEYSIVRGKDSGVFFGKVTERNGREVRYVGKSPTENSD